MSQIDIAGIVIAASETEISVADWLVAKLSQKPSATAMSPAAATPITVRIEVSCPCEWELLLCDLLSCARKGSNPYSLQLYCVAVQGLRPVLKPALSAAARAPPAGCKKAPPWLRGSSGAGLKSHSAILRKGLFRNEANSGQGDWLQIRRT